MTSDFIALITIFPIILRRTSPKPIGQSHGILFSVISLDAIKAPTVSSLMVWVKIQRVKVAIVTLGSLPVSP